MPHILLVDDDVELSGMLRDYLNQDGFEATAVHGGEQGVEEALSGCYAIIVLDVMMPGISGIEVLRRIRAVSSVPVLMLTAKGDDMDRIVGLELGADDYVPKPCQSRELAARLRAILRRTQPLEAASGPIIVGPLTVDRLSGAAPRRMARQLGRYDQHRVQPRRSAGSPCRAPDQ